ncbi:MAG: hypothetical protein JNK23_18365 [Opitutaceae bacterium]|nr:hypothetical protein [Opitutaceae bacterium]
MSAKRYGEGAAWIELLEFIDRGSGEYAVVLADGTKLRLSRSYQERIAALLKQSLWEPLVAIRSE